MSGLVLAIFLGLGVGAWVFNKMSRRTGNNARTSLIVAGVVGLLAAFVLYTLLQLVFPNK